MGLKTWIGLKKRKRKRKASIQPSFPGVQHAHGDGPNGYRILEEGIVPPSFPIDVVYTWVDSADPDFQATLSAHLPPEAARDRDTMGRARFVSHDELRYSMRSIEYFAPWFNHIYIVTNGQMPHWLAPHPKVSIVRHEQILDSQYLPTFNSHVIESALHRIPNLSEHYIYFNDDVMLLRPIDPSEAFTGNGLAYGFVGNTALPGGRPQPYETATAWAAKNARDLILREWGQHLKFDRRFAHMFAPQRKSVAEQCEAKFAREYHAFRQNKFRKQNDILCSSFLHPIVAYLTGRGLFTCPKHWYLKIRHTSAAKLYESILAEQGARYGRIAACLNDATEDGRYLPQYAERMLAFLDAYYPFPSAFEIEPPRQSNWNKSDAKMMSIDAKGGLIDVQMTA